MRAISYRSKFLEVLCEVCDLSTRKDRPSEFKWTADYVSRYDRWYRFRGHGSEYSGVAEGRMLDTDTGRIQHLSPSLLTFVMLEFDVNELIAAYTGPLLPTVCIARDLMNTADSTPEVLAITIKKVEDTDPLNVMEIATSLLFVGFERSRDANLRRGILAETPEMVSRDWFHDRHVFLPRTNREEV